ncbi:hypothetical protein ACHAXT_012840 [Thalassiosira profunda]
MADEAGSYAGTLDMTGGPPAAAPIEDSSKRYSTLKQHRLHVFVGIVFVLAIVAIALGASSVARSNEALRLAESHEQALWEFAATASAPLAAVASGADAPSAPGPAPGGAQVADVSPPVPAPGAIPAVPVAEPMSAKPTFEPTSPHPLNPKWFHTDHAQYQAIVQNDGNAPFHSHIHAGMFCHRQSLHLCPLDVYCPSGQGTRPFGGGPPEFTPYKTDQPKQWAPYLVGADPESRPDGEAGVWIQVGTIGTVDGGYSGNGFGQCWTWDNWMMGGGGDIEQTMSDEYRQWILCCEAAS